MQTKRKFVQDSTVCVRDVRLKKESTDTAHEWWIRLFGTEHAFVDVAVFESGIRKTIFLEQACLDALQFILSAQTRRVYFASFKCLVDAFGSITTSLQTRLERAAHALLSADGQIKPWMWGFLRPETISKLTECKSKSFTLVYLDYAHPGQLCLFSNVGSKQKTIVQLSIRWSSTLGGYAAAADTVDVFASVDQLLCALAKQGKIATKMYPSSLARMREKKLEETPA